MADATVATFGNVSSGNGSFHSWLILSRYVSEVDDRAASKTGRRKATTGAASAAASLPSALPDVTPLPGKRKARRLANDRLLAAIAGPLDSSAITSLYCPPPWGPRSERPLFERLTEVRGRTAEEEAVRQAFMEGRGEEGNEAPSPEATALAHSLLPNPSASLSAAAQQSAVALTAWRRLPKPSRQALRRCADWPLVAQVEETICSFILSSLPHSRSSHTGGGDVTSQDDRRKGSGSGICKQAGGADREAGGKAAGRACGLEQGVQEERSGEMAMSNDDGTSYREGCMEVKMEGCIAAWLPVGGDAGEEGGQTERVLVFDGDDAFVRLLVHAICTFHGLHTMTMAWDQVCPFSCGGFEDGRDPQVVLVAQYKAISRDGFRLSNVLHPHGTANNANCLV